VENTPVSNIIDSIEKLLRYLIPGVTFFLLFALSCPKYFDTIFGEISDSEILVFLSIFTIGVSIYVVHHSIIRFTLEQLAYILNLSPVNIYCENRYPCSYSKAHAKLILSRKDNPKYPEDYYIYLWAIVHYSFIMSWLIIIFSYLHEETSWVGYHATAFRILGFIILVLSLSSYFYMQALEKNTTAELKETKKA
jgi:hypothetical protein